MKRSPDNEAIRITVVPNGGARPRQAFYQQAGHPGCDLRCVDIEIH